MKHNNTNIVYIIVIPIVILFGVLALMYGLENTGYLLCFLAFYLLTSLLFLKSKAFQKSILGVFLTVICISSVNESIPDRILPGLFFVEILAFYYVYLYFDFRSKNGVKIVEKWGIIRLLFRLFFIATTVFLIVSILYEHQPFIELLDPYYIIIILIFSMDVLISHLYHTIQLKQEKTQAELLLLKSQLNPHFFFNTLNNLYALTIKNSKQAPDMILKLSEMMRYTIYDGEKNSVSIGDEILYLKNYIDLHKIRYKKPVVITFHHSIDETLHIAPLLFINLLENAFKHGVETTTKDAYIILNLTNDDNFIYFSVENNFEDTQQQKQHGIGLKNLKRRLSLLYPKKHAIEFVKKQHTFKVNLKIAI